MTPANMAGMGEDARRRLGRLIEERRVELGLSLNQVGDMPGITRPTWTRAESGLPVQALKYAAIERVLGWSPGSVRAILAGGSPTPASDAEQVTCGEESAAEVDEPEVHITTGVARAVATAHAVTTRSGDFDLADEIDFVSRQHQIPVEERMRMVKRLVELWREHQEREEAARAQAQAASR